MPRLFECEVKCKGCPYGEFDSEMGSEQEATAGHPLPVLTGLLTISYEDEMLLGMVRVDAPYYPEVWAHVIIPGPMLDKWASRQPASVVPPAISAAARARSLQSDGSIGCITVEVIRLLAVIVLCVRST